MIARATMPAASKKFLVSRLPGSAIESIPKHPPSVAHASDGVEQQLTDADLARTRLDIEVSRDAPAVPRP